MGKTIRQIVIEAPRMDINGWLRLIERYGIQEYQDVVIECAEYYDKIVVVHVEFGRNLLNI